MATIALAPEVARADSITDRVEFHMYGRIGMSWNTNGVIVEGRRMNLTGRAIGGRFEEGDYLEPTITTHILKPADKDKDKDPYIDLVLTPSMFVRNGSFIGALSNNTGTTLGIELFQAYLEAGNILVPGLKFWGGARFYRGTDVHIADNFFYNNLSGQGGGIMYKDLELGVFVQTSLSDLLYAFDTNADKTPDVQRARTVFTAQYTLPLPILKKGTKLQFISEFHVLPEVHKENEPKLAPTDVGGVAGAKLTMELGNGNFNQISVRYGGGIANGTQSYNAQTWYTFGLPDASGRYRGAYGIEAVEHFLVNFGQLATLNGYGMVHASQGGEDRVLPQNRIYDFAAGLRGVLYAHKQYHLVSELQYQGRKDGTDPWGTLVKVTISPTIVPTGEKSFWARPHMRLIYTAGFYNDQAANTLMSPYLQTVGRTRNAHYIGARSEWWF
jgi:maltoporin